VSEADTNDQDSPATAPSHEELARELRLRPERPRIVRLSRKVLGVSAAGVSLAIAGAVLWALENNRGGDRAPEELFSTEHRTVAEELSELPRDYTALPKDVPRLGPPLPGDLGRPIVAAQNPAGPLSFDAEQQRLNQETEAARTSKVFAPTSVRQSAMSGNGSPVNRATSAPVSSSDETNPQNGQDRKLAFVNAAVDRRTTTPDRLARPASPFVVQAGSTIPAALITGIRSDLPGQITAQVTENVYDSPTGRALLIPQGARLIGVYDSQITFGQSRVLLVWTRLIMPNGRSIVLERQPGADSAGSAGLEDDVDNHWAELFKAALLSTLLSVGTEVGSGSNNGNNADLIRALRRGAGDATNQTGSQVLRRSLNIQPTLTIRSGFPVRVMVNRDLVLEPYRV
jgi:type IV secretory pathway VirB10-like protein